MENKSHLVAGRHDFVNFCDFLSSILKLLHICDRTCKVLSLLSLTVRFKLSSNVRVTFDRYAHRVREHTVEALTVNYEKSSDSEKRGYSCKSM